MNERASLVQVATPDGMVGLTISGRLDAASIRRLWPEGLAALERHPDRPVRVDGARIAYCDTAGAAMLLDLMRQPRPAGAEVRLVDLPPGVRQLVNRIDLASLPPHEREAVSEPLPLRVGRAGARLWAGIRAQIEFVGQVTIELVAALMQPSRIRWRDTLAIAHEAGVRAAPIVALIAFLIGVILAFQGATALQRFGAEVFVADLVGLALLRELAPLMTAILLAGRSGAAFAAEIGSMKVDEEIDALTTMGFDPVRFLVVSRVLATVAVVPVLTLFADLIGLIGGALVMLSFDVSWTTYYRQVTTIVGLSDLYTGLGKSLVFGLLVAGVGCLRGLQTGTGASAVGLSATSAVVSGIVLIVAADGVFAVVFYAIGL